MKNPRITLVVLVVGLLLLCAIIGIRRGVQSADKLDRPRPENSPTASALSQPKPLHPAFANATPSSAPNLVNEARTSTQAALAELVKAHKAAYQESIHYHRSEKYGLEWDWIHHYTEARLLALCHPEETEESLRGTVGSPQAEKEALVFAAKILGVLALSGRRSSEELLMQLAKSKDQGIVKEALEGIFAGDKDGRNRSLYWAKCSEGVQVAFGLGPYWPDGQTRDVLTKFVERCESSTPPKAELAFLGKESLERMSMMSDATGESNLEKILALEDDPKDRLSKMERRQAWALRVVQFRPTQHTMRILRERLDRAETMASGPVELGRRSPTSVQMGYVHSTGDKYYDDVLLTYTALGGKLNQTETQRLIHYGYLGDPKVRLEQLIPSVK